MAATETGVWNLQEVRDKQLASEWTYTDPTIFSLYEWGSNSYGQLGQNQASAQLTGASSPIQINPISEVRVSPASLPMQTLA